MERSQHSATSSANTAPPAAPQPARPSTSICCSGGHAFGQSHCWPLATRVVATPPGCSRPLRRSDATAASACAAEHASAHRGVKEAAETCEDEVLISVK